MFASGYFLTTTGGHFLTSGHALEVDGPYGWVKAIREQIKNGVDHIKVNLSGGIMGPAWDLHTHSFLLDDEICAAFEICRKRGFKVMAHATNPDAVKNAIRLGAQSIEHGYTWMTSASRSCSSTIRGTCRPSPSAILPPARPPIGSKALGLPSAGSRRRCAAAPRQPRTCTRRGSAQRSMPVCEWHWAPTIRPLKDAALLEMGLWVRDGATPWQTLVAATRHGAEVCGVGAELGTVEVGKQADLIVVAANPLEDITNVRRLQLVLKEGRAVSDKRHLSGAVP